MYDLAFMNKTGIYSIFLLFVFSVSFISCKVDNSNTVSTAENEFRLMTDSLGFTYIQERDSALWLVDTGCENSILFEYAEDIVISKSISYVNSKYVGKLLSTPMSKVSTSVNRTTHIRSIVYTISSFPLYLY